MMKILLALSALLLISCASSPKSSLKNLSPKTPEMSDQASWTPEQKKDIAYESFLRGLKLKNEGRPQYAVLFYKKAWEFDSNNSYLSGELAELYLEMSQYKEALPFARIAWAQDSLNRSTYNLTLGRIHYGLEDRDSTKYYFAKVIEVEDDPRALFEYSLVLDAIKDYAGLVKVYQKILPSTSWSENLVERQTLLCRLTGDTESLISTLQGAWEFHKSEDYGLRLVDVLEDANKEDEAAEVLRVLLKSSPSNDKLALRLARIHVRKKEFNTALDLIRDVWSADTSKNENLHRLAVIEYELGFIDSADTHFSQLVQKFPDDHHTHFYLSSVASLKGDTARALSEILTAISLKPDQLGYQNQLAALYFLNHNYSAAHAVIDSMMISFPDKPEVEEFRADAWLHQAKWLKNQAVTKNVDLHDSSNACRQKAIFHLQKAIVKDTSAVRLFDIASSYEMLDKIDSAIMWFELLIQKYPKFSPALNYYGYTLVDRDLDIEKGGVLIDKALVIEPSSEAYLDSKAWYLYKTGNYKEALTILEFIEKSGFDDPVVSEHHALVLEKLNKSKEAQVYWLRVLEKDPGNKRAKSKIQNNKE